MRLLAEAQRSELLRAPGRLAIHSLVEIRSPALPSSPAAPARPAPFGPDALTGGANEEVRFVATLVRNEGATGPAQIFRPFLEGNTATDFQFEAGGDFTLANGESLVQIRIFRESSLRLYREGGVSDSPSPDFTGKSIWVLDERGNLFHSQLTDAADFSTQYRAVINDGAGNANDFFDAIALNEQVLFVIADDGSVARRMLPAAPAVEPLLRLHSDAAAGPLRIRTPTSYAEPPAWTVKEFAARAHALAPPDDRADGVAENDLLVDGADGALDALAHGAGPFDRGSVTHYWMFDGAGEPFLGPFGYDLIGATLDDRTGAVRLRLSFSRALDEPFPSERFEPALYPGLF